MNLSMFFALWALILGVVTGQTGMGTITLLNTDGSIRSRVGCMETFMCAGVGEGIEWRRFGQRVPLGNTTFRTVTTWQDGRMWRSDVVFRRIQPGDRGAYTCTILGSTPSVTLTVLLFVESVRLEIEPIIPNFDISTYFEQSLVTIACPVATCSEGVRVQFLKGEQVLGEGAVNDTQNTVYNLNLRVDQNTAGTYACKVRTTNPVEMVIQEFNITGAPLPTTPPPTGVQSSPGVTMSTPGSLATSSTGTQSSQSTMATTSTGTPALRIMGAGSLLLLLSLPVLAQLAM